MGLISYHRAGVAKRQARAAIRATRQLGGELTDVRSQNEQLTEIVARQDEMIARLESEVEDLRRRLDAT
jgi:predicted RNase H-like nuclease (RuvC/YqgF family)